jgi:hypothetical protein
MPPAVLEKHTIQRRVPKTYPHLTLRLGFWWYVRYFVNRMFHILCAAPKTDWPQQMMLNLANKVDHFSYRQTRKLIAWSEKKHQQVLDATYLLKIMSFSGPTERENRQYLALLQKDDAAPLAFDSGYGYADEAREIAVVESNRNQILSPDFARQRSESYALYQHAIPAMRRLLAENQDIPSFVDFGVSYAHLDSIIAAEFPNIVFYGVDRSPQTKTFNERYFSDIPNIQFHAADIMDFMTDMPLSGGVLFHMRTLTLLPPAFIQTLYAKARQAGIRYVVGMECIGVSRQTNQPYRFSDQPQPSILFRNSLYLHNYPGLLYEAGYQVERSQLVKTAPRHKDAQILSFTARLCE